MRMSLSEIERMVGSEGHELLRELMQAHVDLRAAQGWPGPRIVSGPDRPGPDEPVCLTAPHVDSSPSGGLERSRLAPERATAFKARRLRERPPGNRGPLDSTLVDIDGRPDRLESIGCSLMWSRNSGDGFNLAGHLEHPSFRAEDPSDCSLAEQAEQFTLYSTRFPPHTQIYCVAPY